MKKTKYEFLKQFTEDILDRMDVQSAVTVDDRDDDVLILLNGDNLGMVIGRHGDTLNSLQHILNVVASNKLGEDYKHVVVEAGNWRQNREQDLKEMAGRALDKVLDTGKEYHFPPMNAADRRTLHVYFTDNDTVVAESEGEGRDRHLVLRQAE